jgi:hypothetical protein
MTKAEIEQLQSDMNGFTKQHLRDFAPIIVDGDRGHATNRRIVICKFFLGYTGEEQRSHRLTPPFRERLERPNLKSITPKEMRELGVERRAAQHKRARQRVAPGVTTFDSRPVAKWMKPYLDFARKNGWTGTLNSGFRDPEESEQECFKICGAPSCAGKCAGKSSNHSGKTKPHGALDVSDFERFGKLMQQCPLEPRILNDLPDDPVHFSTTGH